MNAVRIVLAEDQPAMRSALRTILESDGIEVVAEAGDGDAAVRAWTVHRPDVLVMDLRMPGRDGVSATAELAPAGARVLVLTTFDDDGSLFGALRAGAAGFLLKNAPPEEIRRAVRRVAAGEAVLAGDVVARVMQRAASSSLEPPLDDRLTERERDVLWLVARGLTNGEIAARLGVGEATAKTHVSNVIMKLGVRDRVQAAVRAHASGFAAEARPI